MDKISGIFMGLYIGVYIVCIAILIWYANKYLEE